MDDKQKDPRGIYTSLDTILDTRLPIITKINPKIGKKIIETNYYHDRYTDNFMNISQDIFKALYNARNKNVLKLAIPTKAFEVIRDFIIAEIEDMKTNPSIDNLVLYVNTYPYKLSVDEQDKMLIAIHSILPKLTVKLVYESFKDMDMCWFSENIKAIILYNGLEWLEYNTSNQKLIKCPLINTDLIVPGILKTTKDIDIKATFKAIENRVKLLIDLHILPVELFNGVIKKKKEKSSG